MGEWSAIANRMVREADLTPCSPLGGQTPEVHLVAGGLEAARPDRPRSRDGGGPMTKLRVWKTSAVFLFLRRDGNRIVGADVHKDCRSDQLDWR
jgi:hypothetical protein